MKGNGKGKGWVWFGLYLVFVVVVVDFITVVEVDGMGWDRIGVLSL